MVDKEKISVFVDGEVNDIEEVGTYKAVKGSSDAKDTWNTYHVIGDVLREEARAGTSRDRFKSALDNEPTIIGKKIRVVQTKRWNNQWLKLAASFGFMALVGWFSTSENSPLDVRIAVKDYAAQKQQLALEDAYDEAIREYLDEHQKVSPLGLNTGVYIVESDR